METFDTLDDDEPKSAFQKQQEKLMKRVKLFEAENVAEKDWTMTGEVLRQSARRL